MRLARRLAFFVLLAATASCNLDFGFCGDNPVMLWTDPMSAANLWPGDTLTIRSGAGLMPDETCDRAIANSVDQPEQFTFSVEDSTVVSLSPSGLVTAKAVGTTKVNVDWKNRRSTTSITVTPAVAAIRIVTTPKDTAQLGDTISVTAQAVDAQGNPVTGATLSLYSIFVQHPATSRYVQAIQPYTASEFRFVAQLRGWYTIWISTPHFRAPAPIWGKGELKVP